MHKAKLSEICKTTTGQSFREKPEHKPDGDCAVIQMKDIDSDLQTLNDPVLKIHSSFLPKNQLLKNGDVLYLAKGNNNLAVVYDKNYQAVASSVFFVIRPDEEKVDSEYLAWYLNQGPIQSVLHAAKEGSAVTNINKKSLDDLEIKIPSLLTQKKLVNLYKLWQVEKQKTLKLLTMKERYFNNLVLHEIESDLPEPFADEYKNWVGYFSASLYYKAKIRFKQPVLIKGKKTPVKEELVILTRIIPVNRTVHNNDGSSVTYSAVNEWKFILPSDLEKYNDNHIAHQEKETEIINTVSHSLIESITMVDRYGNKLSEEHLYEI